jgi:hypothetical protein
MPIAHGRGVGLSLGCSLLPVTVTPAGFGSALAGLRPIACPMAEWPMGTRAEQRARCLRSSCSYANSSE